MCSLDSPGSRAALGQNILSIAEAKIESMIYPDAMADDFRRKR
jgi:hypothetical protein